MLKRVSILAVVAMLATATVANAFPPIAEWTFEVSVPTTAGPLDAEGGANAGSGSPGSGSHAGASTYSNPAGNGSLESYSSTNWVVGDYYQFCTSTVGYSGISIEWDASSSNTGPRDFEVQYNVDGGSYTSIGGTHTVLANASPNTPWGVPPALRLPEYLETQDLSSVTALDNANQICVRIVQNSTVSANGATVASSGTSRVDNVLISGVPEPTTLALLAFGAMSLIRRRR